MWCILNIVALATKNRKAGEVMLKSSESVGKWVSIIHRYGQIYVSRTLSKYGIGPGQISFLMVLYQSDGISQDHLANLLNIDKTTAARALLKLEGNEIIQRISKEEDKRVKLVYLTEKARDLEPEIKSTMQHWTEIVTKDFSEEEKKLLFRLLKSVTSNAVDFVKDQEKGDFS